MQTACLHLAAGTGENVHAVLTGGTLRSHQACPGARLPRLLFAGVTGLGCIIPVLFWDAVLGGGSCKFMYTI